MSLTLLGFIFGTASLLVWIIISSSFIVIVGLLRTFFHAFLYGVLIVLWAKSDKFGEQWCFRFVLMRSLNFLSLLCGVIKVVIWSVWMNWCERCLLILDIKITTCLHLLKFILLILSKVLLVSIFRNFSSWLAFIAILQPWLIIFLRSRCVLADWFFSKSWLWCLVPEHANRMLSLIEIN